MTAIELCWATLGGQPLEVLVEAASGAGFSAVTITPGMYAAARQAGHRDADLRSLLSAAGVSVTAIEPLISPLPGTPSPAEARPELRHLFEPRETECYRAAAALGADTVNLSQFQGRPVPEDELVEAIGGICARAAADGLRIALEFFPECAIPDLATARRIVSEVGARNLGLIIDSLHHFRGGGTLSEVAGLQPGSVFQLQVSDWVPSPAAYVPMAGRLLPGDGELPLRELVAAVHATHPGLRVGVEAPGRELAQLLPAVAARRAAEAVRSVLGPGSKSSEGSQE